MIPSEKNPQTLSIIIPVYNEEKTLQEVVRRVMAVTLPPNLKKEIIIVDDASSDSTPAIIEKLRNEYGDQIKVHTSTINLGKGSSVRFGLRLTSGEIVLVQDADLELDPQEYPLLLAPILSGEYDVVYGSRFKNKNNHVPWKGRLANKAFALLTRLLYGGRLTDIATCYKVFRKEIVNNLQLTATRFEIEPEITAKIMRQKIPIKEVPISYKPRTAKEGKKIGWVDGVQYIITLIKLRS